MDNYQNICQNNENSNDNSEVIDKELRPEDLNSYEVTGNDGCNYSLNIHKSTPLLFFAKIAENAQGKRHCIWVDANSKGRYVILYENHETEMKLVPTEFVFEKYSQAMYYFSACEYLQSELHADKLGTADLESEIKMHLIRLVKLLIHDVDNIDHIDRAIDNEISLTTIHNADNNDKFIPDLINIDDGEWSYLKFNSNSYYLDESNGLQDNDNVLYYTAFHKTRKHVIFIRATAQEPEFKTTVMNHLYISEDDGLGRYKLQTKDGKILKQYFVPAGYVEGCYNRFIELSNDYKKLHDTSNAYSRQTNWCNLQNDVIYFINHILGELKSDLKQEIDKSLEHRVMSLASTIRNPSSFDEFYIKVVETEKRMRLQEKKNTYLLPSLIIFNQNHFYNPYKQFGK
jgi:hypothetical protein